MRLRDLSPVCNMGNTIHAICGGEPVHLSAAPEFSLVTF